MIIQEKGILSKFDRLKEPFWWHRWNTVLSNVSSIAIQNKHWPTGSKWPLACPKNDKYIDCKHNQTITVFSQKHKARRKNRRRDQKFIRIRLEVKRKEWKLTQQAKKQLASLNQIIFYTRSRMTRCRMALQNHDGRCEEECNLLLHICSQCNYLECMRNELYSI